MVVIRPAREEDIPHIEKIFKANKKYLGFTKRVIMGVSIAKTELHVAVIKNKVVGFIRWHKRRDGWSTVYELCVDEFYRRWGIGRRLMRVIGSGPAKLKCHSKNPAMFFYKKLGFKKLSNEVTKGGLKLSFLTRQEVKDKKQI